MKTKILISSAGRRGQLVSCFRESALELGVELEVLATDMRPELSAACQLADRSAAVPPCSSPEFVPALLRLCREHQVSLIVPTIDTELQVLSDAREAFAEVGTEVTVSEPAVVAIARDKSRTAQILSHAGVNVPRTVDAGEYLKHTAGVRWPVILKPRGGSSSIGIIRPKTPAEAVHAAELNTDLIVQEFWAGREYTVNLFFNRAGQMKCVVPHWRIETRAGEVSKGRTEDIPQLRGVAEKLATIMPGARGALCFQAIVSESGEYVVFEINARFGGGYPLAHHAGARFTQWLLEETLKLPCTASDAWRPAVTMLRYDEAIFRVG
jgi:carbamoyl-phosphate synthase large subunit